MPDPLPPPPAPGGPLPRSAVEDKLLLVLCYLGLLAVIPYLVAAGPGLLRFHARQGLALGLIEVICAGVGLVPFIGFVGHLGLALALVLSILGMMKALKGETWRVPVAADLADRFQL